MAQQRLAPDAILEQTGLSGAVTALQDDPDSADGSWLTAPGSNTSTVVRVSFPTPDAALIAGSGLQEFRVRVRKTNHSTNPTCEVQLYENGTLVSTIVSSTTVSSTSGVTLSGTWDASGRNAANIECRVVGTVGGGSPGNRASLEVGAIEWNAEINQVAGNATAGLAQATASALPANAYSTILAPAGLASASVSALPASAGVAGIAVQDGEPAIATLVEDTFTGTDGETISGRTPDTAGGPWEVRAVLSADISDNKLRLDAASEAAFIDTGKADHSVEVRFDSLPGIFDVLVYFRHTTSTAGLWVAARLTPSGLTDTSLTFRHKITEFNEASLGPTLTIPGRGPFTLRGDITGTGSGALQIYVDDVQQTSINVNSVLAGLTRVGIAHRNAEMTGSVLVDSFKVTGEGVGGPKTKLLVTALPATASEQADPSGNAFPGLAIAEATALAATGAGQSLVSVGLASTSVAALPATAAGGAAGTATTGLPAANMSALPATAQGATSATVLAGLAAASVDALAATAAGAVTVSPALPAASVSALAATALGSTSGMAAAGLPTISVNATAASARGAASTAAALQTVAASALAPSARGAAAAGAALTPVSVSTLAATATGLAVAVAGLAVATVSARPATAVGGSSIPGNASANLVVLRVRAGSSTAAGNAVAGVQTLATTLSPLSVAARGAGTILAGSPQANVSALGATASAGASGTASAGLPVAHVNALPATVLAGGAAAAQAGLASLSVTALPATATGAVSVATQLAVASVSTLQATAVGEHSIPGTATTGLPGLSVSVLSCNATGGCSVPAGVAGLSVTPLTAGAIGAAVAATTVPGVDVSTLAATGRGATSAFASTGLRVISIMALPLGGAGAPTAIAGTGSVSATLRGRSSSIPTLVGASGLTRTLLGRASVSPTLDGSSSTEPTLTGKTGSTEKN